VTPDVWLEQFLLAHGAVAGTVHRRQGDVLTLIAAHNIPPPLIQKTRTIPRGKGMAGLAWERDQIVQTCDLKADPTGDVAPAARAMNAHAAAAIPVHDAAGGLRAVVGIAFATERDFTAAELEGFALAAGALPNDG
jgi:L-methionine (R)-S-oxide reductase